MRFSFEIGAENVRRCALKINPRSAQSPIAGSGSAAGNSTRRRVRLLAHAAKSSSSVYITGTTNSVSSVDVISPPITARAIGARCFGALADRERERQHAEDHRRPSS